MAEVRDKDQRDFRLKNSAKSSVPANLNFNKIKVGRQTLKNDVTADLDYWYKRSKRIDREKVEKSIKDHNLAELRSISNFYFDKSGIYSRLCRYMAFLFRYDWVVNPMIYDEKLKKEKVIEGWYKACTLLENSNLKKEFGEIALKVIKNGCYYGYKIAQKSAGYLQELPVSYCRSRYELNGMPAVEFNLKYFDDTFSDYEYRLRVVKMFPKEVQKGYIDYKNGKLPKDYQGDDNGWLLLDPYQTVKFNLNSSDCPLFVAVIPAIMDLEDAQDLDKKKMAQQILKIVIQKMPIDKNGDLIFDVVEAQALHSNAVAMLGDAIGVDVLTTFADVDVADLSDKGNVSSVDQLDKVERTVYNEAGVSQMQFNTSGNLALEKSIANDEATMSDLIRQFETYAESLLSPFNKNPKRLMYKVQILPTTIYNYKDLSKLYKEQTTLGFSKLLPQVALGQTQTSVIMSAIFENKMMDLNNIFVPPQMSSTMSGKDSGSGNTTTPLGEEKKEVGHPETPDEQKSEKTIQNKESAN